jgi:ankyrin repeat protein
MINRARCRHSYRNCRAIIWFVENGHLDVVKYLIEQGADIHAKNNEALRNSAEKGDLDIVKYLVEHGAAVHSIEDYALRYSAVKGHLEIVKYGYVQSRVGIINYKNQILNM